MKLLRRYFFADVTRVSTREKLLAGIFSFVAVLALGYSSLHLVGVQGLPYIVASVGAASVLLFAVPKSPLSQPWPLLGGHFVSALIGVSCHLYIDSLPLAAATSVGVSIVAMYYLRCLHPPGGAAALGAVLGGDEVTRLGYSYVLVPVELNAFLLLIATLILNNLAPNRRYPATPREKTSLTTQAAQWALGPPRFNPDDLNLALKEMDSVIDVSTNDLARIYALAVMHANKRRLGEVSCGDVMTVDPLTFNFDTELEKAWTTLHETKLKAAPVVDHFGRPLGIVTLTDFMHHATTHGNGTLPERLQRFLKRTPGHVSSKPETVGQIMSSPIVTIRKEQHIVEVIPLFTEKGIHHLPVLDAQGKIRGMITRSDVMRAMVLTRT